MACNSLPRRCISNTVASVQGHDKYRVTDENGPANLMVASSKASSNYVIDDLPAAHAPPASCIGGLSRLVGNPPKHPPGPCPSLPPVPLALSVHLSPPSPPTPKIARLTWRSGDVPQPTKICKSEAHAALPASACRSPPPPHSLSFAASKTDSYTNNNPKTNEQGYLR